MPRKTFPLYYPAFLLLLLAMLTCCKEPDRPGFFASIYSDQPLEAGLVFSLDTILQFKENEREVDGRLTLETAGALSLPVEIKCRGERRKSLCDFPPLRLQLKKASLAEHGWGPYRNYKLVTHCSDTLRDEELLLREFLVYKLYESMTDFSLRTQLLRMQYLLPEDTIRRFAILIENEEEMADRLGLREIKPGDQPLKSIHYDHYKRFVLFQYMVGNTDWNVGTGHNTKYMAEKGSTLPIAIPYDFDYSGLVNASYARPYHSLPLTHVRDRYLMYRGQKADDFTATVQEFLDRKARWYSLIENFPYLSAAGKTDVRNYLDSFFHLIEQPGWKDQLFE